MKQIENTYKNRKESFYTFLAVFLLVLFSGSRVISSYDYSYVVAAMGSLFFLKKAHINTLIKYCGVIVGIFIVQYINFGWNTIPGLINFLSKIIFASIVILSIKSKFKYYYFKVLVWFSSVSLIFWPLQLLGISFSIFNVHLHDSILIFNCHQYGSIRNCGPFWEPGAFAGYILVALALFINQPNFYSIHFKTVLILIIALLSTMSTTGYIGLAVFFLLYFINSKASIYKVALAALLCMISTYSYTRLDFLDEKLSHQFNHALSLNEGEYSSSRIGSFMFDFHYVKKNPLTGNGLAATTRYADHPHLLPLWRQGYLSRAGNGFTHQLACFGLIFYLIFLSIFWKNNKHVSISHKLSFLAIILLALQGECYFNYPFFLGMPYLKLK